MEQNNTIPKRVIIRWGLVAAFLFSCYVCGFISKGSSLSASQPVANQSSPSVQPTATTTALSPTPTPRTPLRDTVLQIARNTTGRGPDLSIDTDASSVPDVIYNAQVVLLDNLGQVDSETGKSEIFKIQKAVWTSSINDQLYGISVWITDGQTSAGDPKIVMRAILTTRKAANFQWDSLNADKAWLIYDETSGN